jgi:hypothetical protein
LHVKTCNIVSLVKTGVFYKDSNDFCC